MTLRWDDLRLFLAVVEQGSLSGAARALKLGQPTLSRRIAELEQLTGEALFVRRSQGASLTAAGIRLLPAAQRMAEWASEAALSVGPQQHLPTGIVRLAAPPGVAYELLAPMAVALRRQYPQIQLEVLSGVATLNLGRGEADLALRTYQPQDPDLYCVDMVSSPMRAYASHAYAARLPTGYTAAELDWICWAAPYEAQHSNEQLRRHIPDFKPAFCSDDFIVQLAACKAGLGAMALPAATHRYSALRDLEELAIDLGADAAVTLYLVCHKRHHKLPKVQRVMDFICAEFDYVRAHAR